MSFAAPNERPPATRNERPWGAFTQYALNEPVTVTMLTIAPGQRMSLQSHVHRAELWIVLDDETEVEVGDERRICRAGEEIWIAPGIKHRVGCRATQPVRIMEVGFGDCQLEDITRYEDDYDR